MLTRMLAARVVGGPVIRGEVRSLELMVFQGSHGIRTGHSHSKLGRDSRYVFRDGWRPVPFSGWMWLASSTGVLELEVVTTNCGIIILSGWVALGQVMSRKLLAGQVRVKSSRLILPFGLIRRLLLVFAMRSPVVSEDDEVMPSKKTQDHIRSGRRGVCKVTSGCSMFRQAGK